MRVGIVDLGTNSVRFDIHEVQDHDQLVCLYRMKQMVRLGEDVFVKKNLQPTAIERTIKALQEFKEIAANYDVTEILAAGTSALREAKNSRAFVQRVRKELKINLKVIDGLDEARLIMKAIHAFEPLAGQTFGFLDIGGGSTEAGFCRKSGMEFLDSFQVGAARIRQMFSSYPPSKSDLDNSVQYIRKELGKSVGYKDWPKIDKVLGASGTIKALIRISKTQTRSRCISKKFLRELISQMKEMRQDELVYIPGMEERRVDIILSGAIVLSEFMDFFDAKEIYRTKFALREGLLQEFLEKIQLADPARILKI